MPIEERRVSYQAVDIHKVVIDGEEFTDYATFSFIWEKSYVESPTRTGNGSIPNLNSHASFIVPHLKIDFSMMSIDTYRRIMKLLYSKNEFVVTCYDVVNNTKTTNKMYFSTEEMPKLWALARQLNGEEWVEVLGVQDYTVEMVGTLADMDEVNVIYYLNRPTSSNINTKDDTEIITTQYFQNYEEFIVGSGVIAEISGYTFTKKWMDENGNIYLHEEARTLNVADETKTLKLYAQWTPNNKHNLVLSYGLGKEYEYIKDGQLQALTTVPFVSGQTIGQAIRSANVGTSGLPNTTPNEVEFNGVKYDAYTRYGWYQTSSVAFNSQPVTNDTVLPNRDITVYQIFKPKVSLVTFNSNGGLEIPPITVEYGANIPKPTPYREGYKFSGWLYNNEVFAGTMPPTPITLVAKWEKE